MSLLKANSLTIGYLHQGKKQVIQENLNLQVHSGEFICLIGPNGTGKSTLLKTLSGLQKPLKGWVELNGQNLKGLSASKRSNLISLVLTDKVNIENATVHHVVAMGRMPYSNWWGVMNESDETIIQNAVQLVHLEHKMNTLISELSDGERQRVMIAKAFVQDTPIMILDEPTAHLDLPNRVEIMLLLHRMVHQTGRSVLLSTHELDMALQAADSIWLMAANGGVVTGIPEDMVLNGIFEDAFRSQHFVFNATNGNFSMNYHLSHTIRVQGEKTRMYWTLRALARAGYAAVDSAQRNLVVTQDAWILDGVPYESIGALLQAL